MTTTDRMTDLLNCGQDLQFFAEAPSRVLEVAGWLLDGPLTLAELVSRRWEQVNVNNAPNDPFWVKEAVNSVLFDLDHLLGRVRYHEEDGLIELINPESIALCVRLAKRQHLDDVDLPVTPEEVAA